MMPRVLMLSRLILALIVLTAGEALQAQGGALSSEASWNPSPFAPASVWDASSAEPVTPRGAFLRSLIFPGWGQMASGAPTRGAFFVGAQGGAYWMLGKTLLRQRQAVRFRDRAEAEVEAEWRAFGVQRPDSLRLLASQDIRVVQRDSVVTLRGDQVEDWIALSIFLAFLSATDALVSSHMSRFPEPLGMTPAAARRSDGAWELGVQVPWP